ncbi:hypothetical protein GJW-30_1_03351 [Variibacter gotjawalensis]|uniref:Uncharacterized protein n=1 Tax=Variibacter gotjawalensis TaxID=1333996 RepID=A0A0S3PXX5_9BRAD|nr:hypothetical protein [Variibacter gotjawalensis]NIK46636.1 hypothetical protein [Variibacter gotjawalensis]RZS48539.1 hypothetical protein EV661_0954 [Variibacter gotjawalensis]BAT60801.1 hypothetical protein GJW-30_1_03351 [Variibacter gotjawalensis]
MKKIILAAVGATALLATPALAQSVRYERGPVAPYVSQYGYSEGYVSERPYYGRGVRDNNGHYRGNDPDPNVRLDLRRDNWEQGG